MALRIGLIGRTGQVATEIQYLASPGVVVTALGRDVVDLAKPETCVAAIQNMDADVIINAAAYTAVDKAEEEEALAMCINAEAPGAMAAAAAARGLPFLHISTDYVFDGAATQPLDEEALASPLSVYGRSKLTGERAVAAAGGAHAILRTAWVFSAHGGNFVKTMLRAGTARSELSVVDDQTGGPTAARDIAGALAIMAKAFVEGRGVNGLFHYSGTPAVTWCGFAHEIFRQVGGTNTPQINPITTAEWPAAAVRPAHAVLDCRRIQAAYGIAQPNWSQSLATVLADLNG